VAPWIILVLQISVRCEKKIDMMLQKILFSLLAVRMAWLLMFGSYSECLIRH